MHCPFCGNAVNRVIDTRVAQGGDEIRRRRECIECQRRFTTRERVEARLPKITKRDQRREDFEDRGDGAFRKWLLGIADLKAKAAAHRFGGVAKRNAHTEVSQSHRAETHQAVAPSPSPSQMAVAAELKEIARRAMGELPEDYQRVLVLAREQRLPLREVAEYMGRTREAVKKLYGRALLRFTENFERLRGGDHG